MSTTPTPPPVGTFHQRVRAFGDKYGALILSTLTCLVGMRLVQQKHKHQTELDELRRQSHRLIHESEVRREMVMQAAPRLAVAAGLPPQQSAEFAAALKKLEASAVESAPDHTEPPRSSGPPATEAKSSNGKGITVW